jgi:hypothetical protein
MKTRFVFAGLALLCALSGCLSVKTHSTIDPIYMTLDVNLKVQLQKELSDAFGAIDAASDTILTPDSKESGG